MKITERENLLLRRALDKATTPSEAETAAKAFVESLRHRGVSGYDFVPPERSAAPPRATSTSLGTASPATFRASASSSAASGGDSITSGSRCEGRFWLF